MFQAALCSVAAFGVADQNPAYLVLVSLGMLVAWAFSVRPSRPAPRLVINAVLLLVVLIAGIEMLRVGVGVSAFAVFVALLLVVKLLDLRTPRDDGQILVLTVSILIAAVLTSNGFLTGVLMVVGVASILRAVILFQLHSVLRLSAPTDGSVARAARIDIRSLMIASMFICAMVGSAVFIVLPRNVGSAAFGQWGGASRSVSGFSDEMELGRPGLISTSPAPVLDLTITDRNGRNTGGTGTAPIYLRGAVLDEYNAGRWNRGQMMRMPLTERISMYPAGASLSPRDSLDYSRWDQQFNITLRSTSDGPAYLFSPWRTIEFRLGDQPMRLGSDFQRGLFLKDGMGGPIEYSVRTVKTEFRSVRYEPGQERSPVTHTQISPRIVELSREIVSEGGIDPDPATRSIDDDVGAVRLLENYLRTQYAYTLDAQPVPEGRDATEWFLFERRAGHCEYYASALALMSRSVGIPARVITGYVATDYNPVTGQYLVRQSNAHAWIEAEIAPGAWRTFDGTPPSDFHSIHVPDPGMMHSISRMYESIEFFWVRTVVGYDAGSRQRIMGKGAGDFGLSRMGERLLNRIAAGRIKLVSRAGTVAAVVFAGSMFVGIVVLRYQSILAAIVAWWLALARRLRPRLGSGGDGTEAALARLERAVHRALARRGAPKPEWMPLKAHLGHESVRLADDGALRGALDEAADLLYLRRFGPVHAVLDRALVSRLMGALRRSEKP